MAFSINTNKGALIALQTLNKTNEDLKTTQTRINTGMKVGNAKDDGATFSIANKLRGEMAGLNAVSKSLDLASSTMDVALAAGEAVNDLLLEMRGKATEAASGAIDNQSRSAINEDFKQLSAQIDSIVDNAEFNGVNAVKAKGDNIVSLTNASTTSSTSISIQSQDMSAGGLGVSATGTDLSTSAAAEKTLKAVGTAISSMSKKLSTLGSGAKRLELQKNFVGKLSDAIEVGIGNLVDADMAKESAKLQALQVQQQLGMRALGIANQAPQQVLGLFG